MTTSATPTSGSTADVISLLLGGAGGLFSGLSQGAAQSTAQKEGYDLSKLQLATQQAALADQVSRQSQTNPLRDQAIFNLKNSLSMGPKTYNPTSYLTPTNTSANGPAGPLDPSAITKANAAYTPGAGGVTNTTQQQILNALGYGDSGANTLFGNTGMPAGSTSSANAGTFNNAPTAAITNPYAGQMAGLAPGAAPAARPPLAAGNGVATPQPGQPASPLLLGGRLAARPPAQPSPWGTALGYG